LLLFIDALYVKQKITQSLRAAEWLEKIAHILGDSGAK